MKRLSVNLELVILRFFEDLDTSFSLMCAIKWRYGDVEALVELKCSPEDYDTPEKYFRSAAALAFVKKLQGLFDNADQRRASTFRKWIDGEVACTKTNHRLDPYLDYPGNGAPRDEAIHRHLAGVRAVVLELIGPGPSLDAVAHSGRFGPGATFVDRGNQATVPHKISSDPSLTPGGYWFLLPHMQCAWGEANSAISGQVSFVRGNRFATAPKTSVIDRAIAVEPSLNVFYQLGVGRLMRKALERSHGWDLDYAQDVHRLIAERASVSREFATLDLSNASDTVSTSLVRLLLPRRWYEMCNELRSPYTRVPKELLAGYLESVGRHFNADKLPSTYDPKGSLNEDELRDDQSATGRWIRLEKFSSMGNGYTFELETVLFAAMAIYTTRINGGAGVLGYDTFVFGDDIIVRDEVVKDLTALLRFCGFGLNDSKSFWGWSPFRESCGADFYVGSDVRPSYLKEIPADVQGSFGVANRLYAAYERISRLGGRPSRRAWHVAVANVPLSYRRCRGPLGLGDNVIWDNEGAWRTKWRYSIRYIFALKVGKRAVVPFARFRPEVVQACAVYGIGNTGTPCEGGRESHQLDEPYRPATLPASPEGVSPRDNVRSYVTGWLAFS